MPTDILITDQHEIKKGIEKFEEARSGKSRYTMKDIIEQALNPILPTYWKVFHTHNIARIRNKELPCRGDNTDLLPCYDVGIFLVGFSSIPIALSLAEIQPAQKIYFLYSSGMDGTQNTCFEIADRMEAMLQEEPCFNDLINRVKNIASDIQKNGKNCGFGLEVDNPSDPVETFKRIKEVIDKVGDKRIALDLTGGKKTMIGGGFTAGSILGFADSIADSACDMFYIDSLEYDQHRGSPTPGTEFLTRLDNPYNVYNVQSVQQAEKLFEKHNYEAAADLWEEVGKKLEDHASRYGLEKEQDTVQEDLDMADCYGLWDAFDYKTACERARCYGNSWGYDKKHMKSSINVLDILSEVEEDPQTLFGKLTRIIHYAVDRYQNGIRRMNSDRFDDAIVRFTQVVEILCHYRIHQIARNGHLVNESDNVVSNAPNKWEITPLLLFLFAKRSKYNRRRGGYYKITECNELLDVTDYGYNDVELIIDLIEDRNAFIHVKNNPEWGEMKKNAENLQKLARKFLENFSRSYCCEQYVSFDNLLELHRFRR